MATERGLDPDVAVRIMFVGMERGPFTGKAFDDYFKGRTGKPVDAGRIINGQHGAAVIAGNRRESHGAISYTTA